MPIYYKFQDIFQYLLDAPDRATGDEKIKFEQMMTADFIGTLNLVKGSDTREDGDKIVDIAISGLHERFADKLNEIKDVATRAEGHRVIDSLLVLMNEYAATLVSIKNAPSREEGDAIIKTCLV